MVWLSGTERLVVSILVVVGLILMWVGLVFIFLLSSWKHPERFWLGFAIFFGGLPFVLAACFITVPQTEKLACGITSAIFGLMAIVGLGESLKEYRAELREKERRPKDWW